MWISAERDVFADGQREHGFLALRHGGHARGQLTALGEIDDSAVNDDRSMLERHAAQQRAHQRALAAAIRPDDRGDASARSGKRYRVERQPESARIAHRYLTNLDH